MAARGVGQRDILNVDLTESLMKQEEEYVKSNSKLPAPARWFSWWKCHPLHQKVMPGLGVGLLAVSILSVGGNVG